MLTVVTATDPLYAPGAIALHNSILRNVPEGEIDFWCLAYGPPGFADSLPMQTLDNPPFPPGTRFPKGGRWAPGVAEKYPEGQNPGKYAMPAMYSRVLIPDLFPSVSRSMWVDADCVVMRSISAMEEFDFGGACMASTDISEQYNAHFDSLFNKHRYKNPEGKRAPGTGTMLINHHKWREKGLTQKCIDLMNEAEEGEWLAVVQSCIVLAVDGDFATYGWEWMWDMKRFGMRPNIKIAHFPIALPDPADWHDKPANMKKNIYEYWVPYMEGSA